MADFEERLCMSILSHDIIRIVTKRQQQEIVAEEEIDEFGELTIGHLDDLEDNIDTESEQEEQNPYVGMEFYHNRDDEEQAELEAITRKSEMFGWEEQQQEPELEPKPLTINVEEILKDLWMMEKEDGFFGLYCEELCS